VKQKLKWRRIYWQIYYLYIDILQGVVLSDAVQYFIQNLWSR